MTKIDENTGLAKVPEDMFWRVTSDNVVDYSAVGVVDYGVRVKLMRKFDRKGLTTYKYYDEPVKQSAIARLFRLTPKTQRVEKAVEGKWTTDEKYVLSASSVTRTYEKPQDPGWLHIRKDYNDRPMWYKVKEVNEQLVRDMSVEVWNNYIDSQHYKALIQDKIEQASHLLGDYPPKTLL